MGFPQKIADEVLVRCSRHCCLCGVYAGSKIELHHIKQVADGGDDSAENCIPLCLNCHAEVKAYNPHHPKGRKFTETELKGHRDKYYALFSSLPNHPEEHDEIKEGKLHVFPPKENIPVTLWGYPEQDKACYLLPGKMLLIAGYTGTRKSTYVQHIVNTKKLIIKKEVCSFRAGNASTLKNLPLYSDISMENLHFFIICCFHINVNWFLRKEVLSHVK